jgi:hypothetical protein
VCPGNCAKRIVASFFGCRHVGVMPCSLWRRREPRNSLGVSPASMHALSRWDVWTELLNVICGSVVKHERLSCLRVL